MRQGGLGEELSFFHFLFTSGFSFGLEFAEQLEVALKIAVDALFVHGEKCELGGLGLERFGVGEREVDFTALIGSAEGEHVIFDGSDSVEAPTVFGDGLRELVFDRVFGFEAVDQFVAEGIVGFAIFAGHDGGLGTVKP